MNQKVIIAITLTIVIAFLLVVGGIVAVYKYYPTYLGLPPNPQDTLKPKVVEYKEPEVIDTVYVEPRIEVPVTEYDMFQSAQIKNAILKYQQTDALAQKQRMADSLANVLKNMAVVRDSIKKIQDSIGRHINYSKALNDSIAKLSERYNSLVKENENTKNLMKENSKSLDKKYDSLSIKNFEDFAKIYNNSNPRDVAKILEQLDERDAALILKKMNKKKAGKILEAMLPENAAAIMVLGVGAK